MALLKYNGKIVLFNGAFTSAQDFTVIELEVSGSTFLDGEGNSRLAFNSSIPNNTMYIDFQDGTGEHAFSPNLGNNYSYFSSTARFYTYQDGNTGRRKIFIRFKDASSITAIRLEGINLYGNFPKSIANYNLTGVLAFVGGANLNKWEAFPTDFRSVNSMSIEFRNTFQNKVVNLAPWVYNSRIQTLILDGIFDLSALPNINHTDKLIDVTGLKNLTLSNSNLNKDSLPSNLKNISTLEYLRIGGNTTLTTLPTALAGCANIKTLHLGSSDGYGYSSLTSWGNGITGMTSLETLTCQSTGASILLETTIPTGLNTCLALKNIDLRGCYKTQARIDEFVTNFYNYIVANPSLTNINLNIGYNLSTVLNTRPSGVYQSSATPTTAMERIYKLVNDYRHTITVTNITNNGNEVLTP